MGTESQTPDSYSGESERAIFKINFFTSLAIAKEDVFGRNHAKERQLLPGASPAPPAHLSTNVADFESTAAARQLADNPLSNFATGSDADNELLRTALQGQLPPAHQPRAVTASMVLVPSAVTVSKTTRSHKATDKRLTGSWRATLSPTRMAIAFVLLPARSHQE